MTARGSISMKLAITSAALGRFISADTIVPDPQNPQALNRYAYALNNPLRVYGILAGKPPKAAIIAEVG